MLPSLRNMVQAAALVRAELAAAAGTANGTGAHVAQPSETAAQQGGPRGGACSCCTAP